MWYPFISTPTTKHIKITWNCSSRETQKENTFVDEQIQKIIYLYGTDKPSNKALRNKTHLSTIFRNIHQTLPTIEGENPQKIYSDSFYLLVLNDWPRNPNNELKKIKEQDQSTIKNYFK